MDELEQLLTDEVELRRQQDGPPELSANSLEEMMLKDLGGNIPEGSLVGTNSFDTTRTKLPPEPKTRKSGTELVPHEYPSNFLTDVFPSLERLPGSASEFRDEARTATREAELRERNLLGYLQVMDRLGGRLSYSKDVTDFISGVDAFDVGKKIAWQNTPKGGEKMLNDTLGSRYNLRFQSVATPKSSAGDENEVLYFTPDDGGSWYPYEKDRTFNLAETSLEDVGQFVANLPTMALELGGGIYVKAAAQTLRAGKWLSLAAQTATEVGVSVGGEAVKQNYRESSGTEFATEEELDQDLLVSGVAGGAGGLMTILNQSRLAIGKGTLGVFKPSEKAAKLEQEALQTLGMEDDFLTAGQSSKGFRPREKQLAAFSTKLQEEYDKQSVELFDTLKSVAQEGVSENIAGIPFDEAKLANELMKQQAITTAIHQKTTKGSFFTKSIGGKSSLTPPEVLLDFGEGTMSKGDFGKSLMTKVDKYDKVMQRYFRINYPKAQAEVGDDVIFSLGKPASVADNFIESLEYTVAPTETVKRISKTEVAAKQGQDLSNTITTSSINGAPPTTTDAVTGKTFGKVGTVTIDKEIVSRAEAEKKVWSANFSSGFIADVKTLASLEKEVSKEGGKNALERMVQIRQIFADYAFVPESQKNAQSYKAKQIYKSLTEAIENPISGNKEWLGKWKVLNKQYSDYKEVKDTSFVVSLLNEQDPVKVANALLSRDAESTIKVIQETVSKRDFRVLQEEYQNTLLRNMEDFPGQYKSLSKTDAFNLMTTPEDRASLEAGAIALDMLETGPLAKAMKRSISSVDMAVQVAESGNSTELKTLFDGPSGEYLKMNVRMGLADSIIRKALTLKDGAYYLNPKTLANNVKDFDNLGIIDLVFEGSGKDKMKALMSLADKVASTASPDSGAALQVASISAGMSVHTLVGNPNKFLSSSLEVRSINFEGGMLLKKGWREMILNSKSADDKPSKIRAVAVGAAQAIKDYSIAYEKSEEALSQLEALAAKYTPKEEEQK